MKRIILIEDDEPIRDIFDIVFKESGYELLMLENGDELISSQLAAPDLFILDKQISGTDGLDVCRFIKQHERFRDVPVIMLSANPDIVSLAAAAGADDTITKPFTLKRLREVVARYTL